MLLSVIVPIYNTEKYLRRCLDSVVSQATEEVEIILIDDGSRDTSPQICDEYGEKFPCIKVVHQSNKGLSAARNVAIEIAKGDYIAFLDSDDMLAEGFIKDIASAIRKDTPDLIKMRYCVEKKEGEISLEGARKCELLDSKRIVVKILENKIECQIWLWIIKKELMMRHRFPEGRNYEDMATLWKLVLSAKKIEEIDYTYYIYNLCNSGSITKSCSEKNMKDQYDAVNEMCAGLEPFCKECGIDSEILENYKRSIYIYICVKARNQKIVAPFMDEMKKYLSEHNRYNLWKYRHYNYVKLVYYYLFLSRK